jgi:hypothetical protein
MKARCADYAISTRDWTSGCKLASTSPPRITPQQRGQTSPLKDAASQCSCARADVVSMRRDATPANVPHWCRGQSLGAHTSDHERPRDFCTYLRRSIHQVWYIFPLAFTRCILVVMLSFGAVALTFLSLAQSALSGSTVWSGSFNYYTASSG